MVSKKCKRLKNCFFCSLQELQLEENATYYSNASYFLSGEFNSSEGIGWFLSCFDAVSTATDITRLVAESIMLLGACAYLVGAARESHYLGASMFFENLASHYSFPKFLLIVTRILNF